MVLGCDLMLVPLHWAVYVYLGMKRVVTAGPRHFCCWHLIQVVTTSVQVARVDVLCGMCEVLCIAAAGPATAESCCPVCWYEEMGHMR